MNWHGVQKLFTLNYRKRKRKISYDQYILETSFTQHDFIGSLDIKTNLVKN